MRSSSAAFVAGLFLQHYSGYNYAQRQRHHAIELPEQHA
jgi:hypothetical protein